MIIDGSKARTIHPDIHEIIEDFEIKAKNRDIVFEQTGFGPRGEGGVDAPENFVIHDASKT